MPESLPKLKLKSSESRKSAISLFSGAMGLDLGFELQGDFELLACVEDNHAACNSIRKNVVSGNFEGSPLVFEKDIFDLDPKILMSKLGLKSGELDVLIGGPPCQSFSTVGKRGTVQDRRGTLLWQYLKFVVELRPKGVVMENVRGKK